MSPPDDPTPRFEVAGRLIEPETLFAVLDALRDECFAVVDHARVGCPLIYASPSFEQLTGYRPDEALGRDLRFLERNDTDQQPGRALRDALARGEPCRVVLRNYRKDGALFWNEQSHYPLGVEGDGAPDRGDAADGTRADGASDGGVPDGPWGPVVVLMRDASEEVRAREALGVGETMNRLVPGDGTHYSYGLVLHEDHTLTLGWLTRAFEGLTGYTAADVQAMGLVHLFHPDDRRILRERIVSLRRNEPRLDRFRLLTRYGEAVWVEDFATPVFDPEAGRVTAIHAAARDITGAKRAEHDLRRLAYVDALTGLPNRLRLEEYLEQAIAQADRDGSQLAVAFLDLDHFKFINDTRGHDTGDQVVVEIGRRLRATVRGVDTVARWGGDEFILLLPDLTEPRDALPVLERVLARVAEPYLDGSVTFHLSMSIGVDLYPGSGRDPGELIKHADIALFRAKEGGRNRLRFFEPEMDERMQRRLGLEADLRRAIVEDEFVLHYQPRIDLATGRLTGVEALLRWNHPERGLLPPGAFIPIAEESDFIVEIFKRVIDKACRQARAWLDLGTPQRVAVNISPVTLRRDEFLANVLGALERHDLPAALLEVELTETAAMVAVEDSRRKLRELRRLGVHVSLDDFGVAYSSLSHLRRLPLDSLKIDQSFLHEADHEADDDATAPTGDGAPSRSILRAIIALGQSLGLTVIAEGVETREQNELLRLLHCDQGQGYLYGRAVPPDDLAALLTRRGVVN